MEFFLSQDETEHQVFQMKLFVFFQQLSYLHKIHIITSNSDKLGNIS